MPENSSFAVLEVGCGSGAVTLALLSAYQRGELNRNLFCTAVDKDRSAVLLTEENARVLKVNMNRVSNP